jgi:hypothetical protein
VGQRASDEWKQRTFSSEGGAGVVTRLDFHLDGTDRKNPCDHVAALHHKVVMQCNAAQRCRVAAAPPCGTGPGRDRKVGQDMAI